MGFFCSPPKDRNRHRHYVKYRVSSHETTAHCQLWSLQTDQAGREGHVGSSSDRTSRDWRGDALIQSGDHIGLATMREGLVGEGTATLPLHSSFSREGCSVLGERLGLIGDLSAMSGFNPHHNVHLAEVRQQSYGHGPEWHGYTTPTQKHLSFRGRWKNAVIF